MTVVPPRQADNSTIEETINQIPVNLNTLRNSKVNRYKQNFLGDSGYCSNRNRKLLRKKGYIPIIKFNKRNTRDENKIKKNELKGKQLQIYKKRTIVESFFSWIKNFPIINQNYQKTIESFRGLLSLAAIIMISKKL